MRVYGSWAARYAGQRGPVPADVDVLIVGSADLDILDDVASATSQRLGRPVDIRRLRPTTWHREPTDDPFIESVRSHPRVTLHLEPERR